MTEGRMAEPVEAERALEQARATGDPRAIGGAESYLGASYQVAGRREEALEALRAAERTFTGAGLEREAAISRINVARLLSELGRNEEAVTGYLAVSAEEGVDRTLLSEVWGGLVDHFRAIGDPGRLIDLLQEAARRLAAEGRATEATDLLMFEGAAHHEAGEHHQAADCFTRAAEAYDALGETEWAAHARHNLAVIS